MLVRSANAALGRSAGALDVLDVLDRIWNPRVAPKNSPKTVAVPR